MTNAALFLIAYAIIGQFEDLKVIGSLLAMISLITFWVLFIHAIFVGVW